MFIKYLEISVSLRGELIPLIAARAFTGQKPWEDSKEEIEKIPILLKGSVAFILPKNQVKQSESDILIKPGKFSQIEFFLCLEEDKCPYATGILSNTGFYKTSDQLSIGRLNFYVWRISLCGEFKMPQFSIGNCKIVVFAKESQKGEESVRRDNVVYDSIATEKGVEVWNDTTHYLEEVPDFLEGSNLFRIPYNLKRDCSDFRIRANRDSIVYIAQNATNRAYSSEDFKIKFFRGLKGKKVVTTVCTLDEVYYYKGTGNESQGIQIELNKPTFINQYKIAIFIKKGKTLSVQ